jgi:hypothetical protein
LNLGKRDYSEIKIEGEENKKINEYM